MEIAIKRIGYKTGTVGWLAAGLQAGTITLKEGEMKSNGHHGLWLKGQQGKPGEPFYSQFLAAYDEYNVGDQLTSARKYAPASDEPGLRESIWTDAAWETLMEIAADWCEMCNAEREEDQPVNIKIARVA
jgi:hypothetical protein